MMLLRVLPLLGTFFLLTVSCTSASREGLPPGSPFADPAARETLLPYGMAVGDVTSHSAILWVRTEGLKAVQVEWASVEAWEKAAAMASVKAPVSRTPRFVTGPYSDFTLSIPLDGLTPGMRYRYHILVGGAERSAEDSRAMLAAVGEFATLPEETRSVPLTFAWSGDLGGQERCRQGEAGYPIFDVIRAHRPDFFLFLGDTIYSDSPCPSPPNEPGAESIAKSLPEYRARHRYQRGAAALRRFLEAIPVFVIWDDHEVRDNFAGPYEGLMTAGRQALREYWPIRTNQEEPHRLYRSIRYGADLELFILDTRQYRSSNADQDGPAKTMLGAAQLAWLLQGLESSTATWKVVATSVPLSIPKPGPQDRPGFDGWNGGPDGTGFERERQVIVDAILSKKMKNVLFLGGDVHYIQANSYDPNQDGTADFHEYVAGPLSARAGRLTPPSPGLYPTSLVNDGGYFNFGFVRVTPTTFEVSFVDDAGKTRFSHRLQAR
jgi:alkaline phosphatase D